MNSPGPLIGSGIVAFPIIEFSLPVGDEILPELRTLSVLPSGFSESTNKQ